MIGQGQISGNSEAPNQYIARIYGPTIAYSNMINIAKDKNIV